MNFQLKGSKLLLKKLVVSWKAPCSCHAKMLPHLYIACAKVFQENTQNIYVSFRPQKAGIYVTETTPCAESSEHRKRGCVLLSCLNSFTFFWSLWRRRKKVRKAFSIFPKESKNSVGAAHRELLCPSLEVWHMVRGR